MKQNAGLNLDCLPVDQPDGSYRDAQNMLLTAVTGVLSTEPGTAYTGRQQDGYTLLKMHPVNEDDFVLFYKQNEGTLIEIGFLSATNQYRSVATSNYLPFATLQPLQVAHYLSIESDLIVTWTDGVNPPGVINITKTITFTPLSKRRTTTLRLFPEAKAPNLSLSESIDPGTILAGGYSFLTAYELDDQSLTNYYGTYGSVLVGDGDTKVAASASIAFVLSNLDPAYTHLRLFAVRDNQGTRTGSYIGRVPTSATGFTWTGNSLGSVAVDELLLGKVSYTTARTLTVIDNKLLLGNLTTQPAVDAQPYANAITVRYRTQANAVGNNVPSLLIQRSFCPSATYALYRAFIYPDGSKTLYDHIPGRASDDADVFTTVGDSPLRKIDVSDYATATELSFHRNEDETYPDEPRWQIRNEFGAVTGTLSGQKVRHHRMPSAYRSTGLLDPNSSFGTRDIGLVFENIIVPPELVGKVVGVCFAYAVREWGNMDVVAFIPVLSEDFALQPNDGNVTLAAMPASRKVVGNLRGYDFTLLTKKPVLKNLFMVTEYENYAHVQPSATLFSGSGPGYSGIGGSPITYLPANNILVGNEEREEAFRLSIPNVYGGAGGGKFASVRGDEQVSSTIPIASLRQHSRNLYVSFDRQSLSAMSYVIPLVGTETTVDSQPMFEGDVTRQHDRIRFMRASSTPRFTDNTTVYKAYSTLSAPSFSRLPINKRNIDLTLEPVFKTTLKKYGGEYLNQYLLNPSYELTNTFRGGVVSTSTLPVSTFPNRIAQSYLHGSESRRIDWRSFAPLDYHDHKPTAGPLVNLEAMGETLVLHHTTGVYRTLPRQKLETAEATVFLGTGALFDQVPQELITAPSGYAGIRFSSGTMLSKYGYLFIDSVAGKVFLLNEQLSEISTNGMRTWFNDNAASRRNTQLASLGITIPEDNPFMETGVGYTLGYDERYQRLLIGSRDYELDDKLLWGTPDQLLTHLPVVGKYYLVNGELYKAVADVVPVDPIYTYTYTYTNIISTLDWVKDNRVVAQNANADFVFDKRVSQSSVTDFALINRVRLTTTN